MGAGDDRVLIVEDDADLRDVYDRALSQFYAVSTAATGTDAVETMTGDTDVVLLDRRLPDTPTETLVRELQNRYRDCYIALVTGVEPGFDIIELGIDDYLVKPVTTDQLREAVDRLTSLAEYDATYRTLSQKRVKRNVLAQEKSAAELRTNDEFERLQADIDRLEAELDDIAETVDGTIRGLEP